MAFVPNYEESHLVVAAVRLLQHRNGHLPTPEEVAGMLTFPQEKVFVLIRGLKERAILRVLESPFETRVDILDPVPLEALPRGVPEPEMKGELDEFYEREREKKAEMDRMFRGGEVDRRKQDRVKKLEEEFRKFKPKGGPEGLFKSDEE
ncbi:MAG: hypothetical protein IT349_03130 [Candidatus Eisenbacteria bacterium]|nr:hypothetical protein [Candidatus Eisenbacteria bacterium]